MIMMASQVHLTSQYDMFLALQKWCGRQIDGLIVDMIISNFQRVTFFELLKYDKENRLILILI
jgi:hypothetical protein